MIPIERLPDSWKTTATLIRGGGRDPRGNPLPTTEEPVQGGIFAPRSTAEPVDRSDLTDATAVLYMPPGATAKSTDRVRVSGRTWAVDGEISVWPLGVEVPLRKETV